MIRTTRTNVTKKVLLIDDDRMLRHVYADCLSSDGFEVSTESSALDALERLVKKEEFDLVIVDIMMAKMDGWEFLDMLRNKLHLSAKTLPVIIISAFESVTLEFKALQHDANASYIKGGKPLSELVREARIQTGRERSAYDD